MFNWLKKVFEKEEKKNWKDDPAVREVCRNIADFYLLKNQEKTELYVDSVCNAEKEIRSLGICKIVVNESEIEFHVTRPGILIGPRGANITNLESYLGKKIKIFEDQRIDDLICCYLPYVDWDVEESASDWNLKWD